jgi:hypothetical protein
VCVYIGATEEHQVPARVLESSIRRTTAATVEIRILGESARDLVPSALRARGHTSFTFQRFAIPALQGFAGRALYLDSDMLVFRDIRALWETPFEGAQVLCVPRPSGIGRSAQFSVLVLDCGALAWDIAEIAARLERGALTYRALVQDLAVADRIAPVLPPEWNAMETFDAGRTALLHFTRVETQPWLCARNPLGALWVEALFEALDDGTVPPELVAAQVRSGFLRPSLLWQVEQREADVRRIPAAVRRRLDGGFRLPRGARGSALTRLAVLAHDAWSRWTTAARA